MGDIVAMSGVEDIGIGDTVCAPEQVEALPFVSITEPTVTMTFSVNNSPFAGREGEYVTSRHLRARLMRELQTDVSLRVNETDSPDAFEVRGRGELHLSILIENMRRQGYEFQVSKPQVLYKEIDGVRCEPIERMVADVPQAYAGAVIEKIGRRRGVMESMHGLDRVRLEFLIPSRGLFGYRSEFMTDTRGEGIMSSVFEKYEPVKGDIPHRNVGALVCFEDGEATSYGLFYAQERGTLFIGPQTPVYKGMICGQNSRPDDLVVNVCKQKHVTNMRNASASEDSLRLVSVHPLTLEECLEFIDDDELLEITPKSLRMRKRVLSHEERARAARRARADPSRACGAGLERRFVLHMNTFRKLCALILSLCLLAAVLSPALAEETAGDEVTRSDFSLSLLMHADGFPNDGAAHYADWEAFLSKLSLEGVIDVQRFLTNVSRVYFDGGLCLNGKMTLPFVYDGYHSYRYVRADALRGDSIHFQMHNFFEFMLKGYYFMGLPTQLIALPLYPEASYYLGTSYYQPIAEAVAGEGDRTA